MGQVLDFKRPTAVILAFSANDASAPPARQQRTPLGDFRASLKYCDTIKIVNRAFRATSNADAATAEIARATLRHIGEMSDYPQARDLALMFLRISYRQPDGAA